MAAVFSSSEQERVEIERLLLLELTKAKAPDEVATFFHDSGEKEEKLFYGSSMPSAFVQRVKKDLEGFQGHMDVIFAKTGITEKELTALKNSNLCINRRQVKNLATALNQPVDEYLVLSDYLTEGIIELVHNKAGLEFINFLSSLKPTMIGKMLKLIVYIMDICKEFDNNSKR